MTAVFVINEKCRVRMELSRACVDSVYARVCTYRVV